MRKICVLLIIQILLTNCTENSVKGITTENNDFTEKPLLTLNQFEKSYSSDTLRYKVLFEDQNYETAQPFQEDRALVRFGEYYRYITDNGAVLPFKVVHTSETPGNFSDGRALIYSKSNQYGFIDLSGKLVIDTIYQTAHNFSESIASVRSKKFNGYIDLNGKEVLSMDQKYSLMPFKNGIALIHNFKNWGAINKKGEIIIPLEFAELEFFHENYAVATKEDDGKKGLINKSGKFVIEPLYESLGDVNEGLLTFYDDQKEKWGYLNTKGEIVVQSVFKFADDFSEGFAVVANDNFKKGFINKAGKQIIDFKFDEVFGFSEGLAVAGIKITNNGNTVIKYGYINYEGNWVFPPVFNMALSFTEGKGLVLINENNQSNWRYIEKALK